MGKCLLNAIATLQRRTKKEKKRAKNEIKSTRENEKEMYKNSLWEVEREREESERENFFPFKVNQVAKLWFAFRGLD